MNRVPIASWNPERDVWETGQMDLLSGLSAVFSETWPASGMTRNGVAFELPTLGHRTSGTEYSLLPTPTARDGKDSTIGPAKHRPDDTDTLSRALGTI